MQKEVPVVQSMVLLVLVGVVVGQRNQRTIKGWWTTWRTKPKRPWSLRPRTPVLAEMHIRADFTEKTMTDEQSDPHKC